MTDDAKPETWEELRDALDTLIQTAHANGVEVEDSAYALRHDDISIPDWEIHLTRLAKGSRYDR